jgi:hypothetical protein
LRDEPAYLIYDFGYFLLTEMSLRTEEEAKAISKLEDTLGGLDYEDVTGFPAIARQFAPADGSEPPPLYE